jgi:hypothetical protein
MSLEYVIYCDESSAKGRHFSNFYGGVLVRSTDLERVLSRLAAKKLELNFFGEVKWQKVSAGPYLQKYIALIDEVFDLMGQGLIKVRIMFTQNIHVPRGLSQSHIEEQYFILYYQFLKHAFGLPFSNETGQPVRLRLNLDQLPENKERANRFKGYLCALAESRAFRDAKLRLTRDAIADVVSHDHDPLQVLDVILGAIHFRLNDLHLEKPTGKKRRGKKTRAKEALYKHINDRIQRLHPRLFNIGASTGLAGDVRNKWLYPYSHWLFLPKRRITLVGKGKQRNR